eukprot:15445993-Alexandrium_andersonii.AAC.1
MTSHIVVASLHHVALVALASCRPRALQLPMSAHGPGPGLRHPMPQGRVQCAVGSLSRAPSLRGFAGVVSALARQKRRGRRRRPSAWRTARNQ